MKQINIKIEGKAGSGTSVINKIIQDALIQHGIGVAYFTERSKKFETLNPIEFKNNVREMREKKVTCYVEHIQLPRE